VLTATTYRQAAYTLGGVKALRRAARFRLPGQALSNAIVIGDRWHVRAFAAREPCIFQFPATRRRRVWLMRRTPGRPWRAPARRPRPRRAPRPRP
jgi:hypothetical protein